MERILRVLFYALAILFVYLIFSGIYKSCNKKKESMALESTASEGENELDEFEESTSEFFESDEDDDEQEIDYQSTDSDDDVDDLFEEIDDEEESTTTTYEETAETSTYTPPTNTRSNSSSGGNYLVIAGTFGVRENAQKMVNRLQRLGYSDAEYLVFDGSSYYSVTAGRYNSNSSATSTANSLKNSGVDCYVHKKQF